MTIRLRVAILTALLVAFTVGITSWLVLKWPGRHIRGAAKTAALRHAGMVAQMSADALHRNDQGSLQKIANAAAGPEGIHVRITDSRGVILADSSKRPSRRQTSSRARKALARRRHDVGPMGPTTTGVVLIRGPTGEYIGAVVAAVSTRHEYDAARETVSLTSAAWVLATPLSFIVTYLLVSYLMSPMCLLVGAIRRVASGDFQSRLAPPPVPELREIGEAFNDMATAVTRRVRNLELLNQMAGEISTARRLPAVASAARELCAVVLDADVTLWVFDPYGENLQSVPVTRAGRISATHECPVMQAAREARQITIGEEGADMPSGSRITPELPPVDAAVIVPLATPDGVVGALLAQSPSGQKSMTGEQILLATAAANVVGPVVASLVRMESQVRSARMLQRILIPRPPIAIPGIEVSALYQPAEEVGRTGGDYYDFIRLSDDRWCFTIGDVSGKGLMAAQYTAMAKYVLRSYALEYRSASRGLMLANSALIAQMADEIFITLFCAVFDARSKKLLYSRAGHPPPVLYSSKTDTVRQLSTYGTPVGIFEDARFEETEEQLDSGDVLLLFTDGVSEARKEREMYGEDRIKAVVARYARLSPSEIADSVLHDVQSFSGGRLSDDVALVVMKVK
ncbi:MAG: SpoIIE family protein phosphatase [Armatimonadetes bacterium]|nr:SpoIIE family protein phosphatase [Armatimonadota bacterium]